MIRILDNTPKKLVLDAIKELIKESKNASFAVGYFYLNGWNLIKEDLPANIQKNFLKILIGRAFIFFPSNWNFFYCSRISYFM